MNSPRVRGRRKKTITLFIAFPVALMIVGFGTSLWLTRPATNLALYSESLISHLDPSYCSNYKWAEFGASRGAGMMWVKELFDIDAIGIDIDEQKVLACQQLGGSCLVGDFTAPNVPDNCFSVVSMMHVLEHLPSRALGVKAIESSMRIASDIVLFRGPLWNTKRFEGSHLGLYFSNWSGHLSKFDLGDLLKGVVNSGKAATLKAYAIYPVHSSNSSDVVPINERSRNSQGYHPDMGPKSDLLYNPPILKELLVVIDMNESPDTSGLVIRQQLDDYIKTYLIEKKGGILIGEYTPADGINYTRDFQNTMLEN